MSGGLSPILKYNALVLGMFSPFFLVWSITEFAHFKYSTQNLLRPHLFYPLFLTALCGAYLLETFVTWRMGICFKAALAVCLLLANLVILSPRPRRAVALPAVALLFVFAGPSLEDPFLQAVRSEGQLGLKAHMDGNGLYHMWIRQHIQNMKALLTKSPSNDSLQYPITKPPPIDPSESRIIASFWDRYCHFTLFSTNWFTGGMVNDWSEWIYHTIDIGRDPIAHIPYDLVGKKARIAIIGAGGGRQVREALEHEPEHIWAVEQIPAVKKAFTQIAPDANGGIYIDPRVTPVASDGRSFLKDFDGKLDVVFFPFTESATHIFRTFFEPSQWLYSVESLRMIREKLTPNGVIIIRKGFLEKSRASFKSFYMSVIKAGYQAIAYVSPDSYIIIGSLGPIGAIPPDTQAFLDSSDHEFIPGATRYEDAILITDDYPFQGGIIFYFFPREKFFGCGLYGAGLIAILILLTMGVTRFLRKERISFSNSAFLVLICLLVGMNFMLLEYIVIFQSRFFLTNPLDAFYFGSIAFLALATMGGMLSKHKAGKWLLVLALASTAALLAVKTSSFVYILVGLPVFVASGLFFPALFTSSRWPPVKIYVLDAFGAAFASLAVFIAPLLWGFTAFFQMSLLVFLMTTLVFILGKRARWI